MRFVDSYNHPEWDKNWTLLAYESGRGEASGFRSTEAMTVPDGVILMTTVVLASKDGGSSSSINTMFIPRVKIENKKLVPCEPSR